LLRKLGNEFDLRVVQVADVEKTPSGKHRWLATEPPAAASIAPKPEPQINAVTFHDAKAADWEQLYQRPSFQLRRKVIMGLLQTYLRDSERWLDAGCGSGYFARELACAGVDVVGVDAALGMVEESTARAASEPHAARMSFQQVETIERLPFADASFDGVLCSSVIEYVPDYAQALRELSRVLRPGGVLLVTVPNKVAMTRVLERGVFAVTSQLMEEPWPRYLQHSRWQFSQASLRSAMAEHGLTLQAADYFGPAMPAWLNRHRSCGMMLAALAVKR
jgi:2-polyprenyl-6-hydroxyphenyl methylase/3-demethylubiquinone-9 3-methyltransferase